MIVLDANLWIAAFDPTDRFHGDSIAVLDAAVADDLTLAGPVYVLLETSCAVARRTGRPSQAAAAHDRIASHPSLRLEPLDAELMTSAERIGVSRRLRAADSLYAAVAERLGWPLLSWDRELVARAGAVSPSDWLAARTGGDFVAEPATPAPNPRRPSRTRPIRRR